MIKRFRVRNFKSIADVTVDLSPVTVLIGRSGTGKTNFIRAIRFLRDFLTKRDFTEVEKEYVAWHQIWAATTVGQRTLEFEIVFSVPGWELDFCYLLRFQSANVTRPELVEEKLQVGKPRLFSIRPQVNGLKNLD